MEHGKYDLLREFPVLQAGSALCKVEGGAEDWQPWMSFINGDPGKRPWPGQICSDLPGVQLASRLDANHTSSPLEATLRCLPEHHTLLCWGSDF